MKYKAVIFDLFGTLVKNYPVEESNAVARQMAVEVGAPQDEFLASWNRAFDDRMNGNFRNFQACVNHICKQLGVIPDDGQIERAAGLRIRMTNNEMNSTREGAVEVLSELRERGYKTGLISNCSMEAAYVWPGTILAPLMDAAVLSALEAMKKPDQRIFQTAAKRLAVNPDECLYVADGMDLELSAAKNVGMEAVMLRVSGENDYDQFREQWTGREIASLREIPGLLNKK